MPVPEDYAIIDQICEHMGLEPYSKHKDPDHGIIALSHSIKSILVVLKQLIKVSDADNIAKSQNEPITSDHHLRRNK